jgi:hypothetical protein
LTLKQPKSRIQDLSRRHALRQISLIVGEACALPWLKGFPPETLFAQGTEIHRHLSSGPRTALPHSTARRLFFNPHQFETVDLLCEMIIPQTNTPGARAAKVAQFIDLLLSERETQMQQRITAGLIWLDQRSRELFGHNFIAASPEEQIKLVTLISSPQYSEPTLGQVFFNQIKDLTVFGYYTSKEGLEQELGYAGPHGIGTYKGSVPVK